MHPLVVTIIYYACIPFVLVLLLCIIICIYIKPTVSNTDECCAVAAPVTIGICILVFYLVYEILCVILTPITLYGYYNEEMTPIILWEIGIYLFGLIHYWILARAIHPIIRNCGCYNPR